MCGSDTPPLNHNLRLTIRRRVGSLRVAVAADDDELNYIVDQTRQCLLKRGFLELELRSRKTRHGVTRFIDSETTRSDSPRHVTSDTCLPACLPGLRRACCTATKWASPQLSTRPRPSNMQRAKPAARKGRMSARRQNARRACARMEPVMAPAAPADSSAWEPAGDEESDSWGARGWLASLETAPDLAAALLGGAKPADEFSAMRALGVKLETEEALVALLERGGALPMLAKRLLPELRQLAAGAAAGAPQESKFAGAIELSYSGLDQFYNGLEGQIGAPRPNVLEAMEADHLRGCDCDDEFTTGNYGVTSTSRVEWHFVADPAGGLEHLGREEWPAESEEMLPNREHCRRAEPLEDFLSQMEGKNARLRAAEQPELIKPEVLGGRLYTGCAPATSH